MPNKWTALTVTTVAVFMVSLDMRIMIIGLPTIAHELGADAEEAIWFTQSYQMIITVSLLMMGRISDIVGRVRLYTYGFALFTIGSGLTSLAQDPLQVIAFRGLQGIGGAIILTTSVALITDNASKDELGFALGINQIAVRFGSIVGLTVSGIIISLLDWRALFYLNVPVGLFGTIWAHRRLKEIVKPESDASVDWVGFATFTASITAFLLALTFVAYGLEERLAASVLISFAVLSFIAFIFNERRVEHPLLDLSLFRIRQSTAGMVALILNATAFGGALLLVSVYFQLVRGMSAFDAGFAILPFEFAYLAIAPLVGRLSDRYGQFLFMTSGLMVSTTSFFLLSTADASTPSTYVAAYLILLGLGTGLFSAPNTSSIMSVIPPTRRGIGSAVRSTFFNLGVSVSLNLVILIMALSIPYSIVTGVISGNSSLSQAYTPLFAQGIRNVFLFFGVMNGLALVPSISRGRKRSRTTADPSA